MVTIPVAGFQTVAIFMQSGESKKLVPAVAAIGDIVRDSPNKVRNGITYDRCKAVLPF